MGGDGSQPFADSCLMETGGGAIGGTVPIKSPAARANIQVPGTDSQY